MTTLTDWRQALDGFEADLHRLQRSAQSADDIALSFTFPEALGPLPAELASRARHLVELAHTVQAEVEAALASRREALDATVAAPTHPAAPRFVDARG